MSTLFPKTISYLSVTSTRTKGKTTSSYAPSTFTGSVQPVTARDLDVVQSGRQDTGMVKVYANQSLNISVEDSNTPGDIVIWNGGKYEIIMKAPNQNNIINHYKYLASYVGVYTA